MKKSKPSILLVVTMGYTESPQKCLNWYKVNPIHPLSTNEEIKFKKTKGVNMEVLDIFVLFFSLIGLFLGFFWDVLKFMFGLFWINQIYPPNYVLSVLFSFDIYLEFLEDINRDFTWKKKWKVKWNNMIYCSEKCSRNKSSKEETWRSL